MKSSFGIQVSVVGFGFGAKSSAKKGITNGSFLFGFRLTCSLHHFEKIIGDFEFSECWSEWAWCSTQKVGPRMGIFFFYFEHLFWRGPLSFFFFVQVDAWPGTYQG
jgi:hypothetical protein